MRVPNPSPVLDIQAPMGPENLSSTGVGVWRKAPKAFPAPTSVLDKCQSTSVCGTAFGLDTHQPTIFRDVEQRRY